MAENAEFPPFYHFPIFSIFVALSPAQIKKLINLFIPSFFCL